MCVTSVEQYISGWLTTITCLLQLSGGTRRMVRSSPKQPIVLKIRKTPFGLIQNCNDVELPLTKIIYHYIVTQYRLKDKNLIPFINNFSQSLSVKLGGKESHSSSISICNKLDQIKESVMEDSTENKKKNKKKRKRKNKKKKKTLLNRIALDTTSTAIDPDDDGNLQDLGPNILLDDNDVNDLLNLEDIESELLANFDMQYFNKI